jgi:hypothetical protein
MVTEPALCEICPQNCNPPPPPTKQVQLPRILWQEYLHYLKQNSSMVKVPSLKIRRKPAWLENPHM